MKKILLVFFSLILIFLVVFSFELYVSNPYINENYQAPFTLKIKNNNVILSQNTQVKVIDNPLISFFRFFQGGVRIIIASLDTEKPFSGTSIIAQIHNERFDVSKPYVISAGHFSDFYLRNIGIFYNSILDGCIPSSQSDWGNREKITAQTIALDLALLQKVKVEPTTFSAIWPNVYIPINIYTRSSDSLYSLLYTLSAMQNPNRRVYKNPSLCHALQTKQLSSLLLSQNKANLIRLINQYKNDVIDQKTGLVKKDITLSSARDGIKRQSSFYDNVIAQSTINLANQLGIAYISDNELTNWKNKIIATFWNDQDGLFINDLSIDSIKSHAFSADEFIVLQTHFLDINNPEDKRKLGKMIAYVEKNKLDQPFPLRYAKKNDLNNLYFWVKLAVPMYMGESIWSHWGMEYIKALILMGDKLRAKKFLDIYSENIRKYGGYPEVYDTKGNILRSRFYKSLLHTGWVINYEEANSMLAAVKVGP